MSPPSFPAADDAAVEKRLSTKNVKHIVDEPMRRPPLPCFKASIEILDRTSSDIMNSVFSARMTRFTF